MIKRAVEVPGFHYFDSESSDFKDENEQIFDDLSLYVKFRIFADVIIFEYLSHVFVFRWIFNICKALLYLLEVYPILAIIRFGKKYAFVEAIKNRKK